MRVLILIGLLSFTVLVFAQNTQKTLTVNSNQPPMTDQNEKWYKMNAVGFHIFNEDSPPAKISGEQALRYFSKENSHLAKNLTTPKYEEQVSESLRKLKADFPQIIPAKNPEPFADVAQFSKDKVIISILYPLGAHRWHHYFETIATYEIKRTPVIDEMFDLRELEKKFSYTYKGVGYGTSAGYTSAAGGLNNKLTEILGQPDAEYPGQSPSLRQLYYRQHNLYVEIHEGVVYFVEHRKPDWIEQ
jgi:hypothetical protein